MSAQDGWRYGCTADLERDSLADQLICHDRLRAEVVERVGVRSVGEPSRAYKEWKHRANRLAEINGLLPATQVAIIIRRAIEHVREQS